MQRLLAGTVAGLTMAVLANVLPILQFNVQGRLQPCWIYSGVEGLWGQGYGPVGLLVLLCSMVAPFCYLLSLFYTLTGCLFGWRLPGLRTAWRLAELSQPWALVEVYAVAIVVAVARLDLLGQVYLEQGTFYVVLMFFFTTAITVRLDPYEVEECLKAQAERDPQAVSVGEGEAA